MLSNSIQSMSSIRTTALLLLAVLSSFWISQQQVSARILTECEAAKELVRGGVERSFISHYVCIMKSESGLDTRKKVGPGHKASYAYGVFQITSDKWCSAFRPGGVCNKNCNDFLNDDIQDDIACAKIIAQREGFKHWKGWLKNCKNGKLPNVSGCIIKREVNLSDAEEMEEIEPEHLAHMTDLQDLVD
ncbi:hypothetical protein TKK_0007287 [Trichogramma kaykai]